MRYDYSRIRFAPACLLLRVYSGRGPEREKKKREVGRREYLSGKVKVWYLKKRVQIESGGFINFHSYESPLDLARDYKYQSAV